MKSILIGTTNMSSQDAIRESMLPEYRSEIARNRDVCFQMFSNKRYEFLFIDVEFLCDSAPCSNYKAALQPFWHAYPTAQIIAMSSQDMIREAVKAVKAGASDYLTHPINPAEVRLVIESIGESVVMESELDYLRDRFWRNDSLDVVRTRNPLMRTVFDKVRSVAPTKSTVLITGETGTGKGLLARMIHQHSNRRNGPFISVHCGSIPDTLLESELFGHEKGAFTGAVQRRLGRFEIAQGGTIFLDEIATMTLSAQVRLLHVLQDRSFQRVGGETTIEANARVIAATNVDLQGLCEDGRFRKDLHYRINVFPIELPPLRERLEDIEHIAGVILKRLNRFNLKGIHDIHQDVMEAFKNYSWPGNIREMENVMERAYIIEDSSVLRPSSFPSDLLAHSRSAPALEGINSSMTLAGARRRCLEQLERHYLEEVLMRNRGRIKESATIAGVSTRQLHKLLTKYAIRKETYKG